MGTFDDLKPVAVRGSGMFADLEAPVARGTGSFSDIEVRGSIDPQRRATTFEKVLDVFATPSYATAGAVRGTMRGGLGGALSGAAEGVREKTSFGDILTEDVGLPEGPGRALGFVGDVVLDPLNLVGGLGAATKAGRAARAAKLGLEAAELAGDAGRIADAGEAVAAAGRLGTDLAEQGRLGQRSLLTIGGRNVVPAAVNEAVLGAAERAGRAIGATRPVQEARKGFQSAASLAGDARDLFLARTSGVRGEAAAAQRAAAEALKPAAQEIHSLARRHGLDARVVQRAVTEAVERSKVRVSGQDLRSTMSEGERNVYDAAIADAMKRANRDVGIGNVVTGGGSGKPSPKFEFDPKTGEIVGGAGRVVDSEGVGVVRDSSSPAVKDWRGNLGRLPDEVLELLPPNMARRIRAIEERALQRMTPEAIVRSVDGALSAFDSAARTDLAGPVRSAVEAINSVNAGNLAATVAEGVPISELGDEAINYLRRVMRPEARDLIRDLGGGDVDRGLSRLITEKHGAQKERAFKGLTIPEINDLAEAGRLSLLGNRALKGGLFVEDPFLATITRAGEAGKAIASARMLKDYARRFGMAAKDAPEGWRTVPNLIAGVGEDIAFPPDVASALSTHFERVVQPGWFLRQWDTMNRLWSRHTVGIVPVTEFRNMVGDAWNAVVLGGMNPLRIGDAAAAMAHGTAQGRALGLTQDTLHRLPNGRVLSGSELKALATRHGVMQATEMSQLLDELGSLETPASGLAQRLGRGAAAVMAPQWQARVARTREQTTRLAFFLDRLEKGDAPEVAAIAVKKHLFDYGELTPFERDVLKRFMPFYAWMRNNAPLQMGYLFAKPQAFAGVQKARNELAGDEPLGMEEAEMPRFLREGVPFRAGENEAGQPQFGRLAGYLPAADLGQWMDPGQSLQTLVNSLSPFISQPFESATNIDLFRSDLPEGRVEPVARFTGEQQSMLGIPMDKRWVRAPLENVRLLSELDRLNPFGVFGDEESGPFGMPRSRPDVDPLERALNLVMGRTYALDPETEAMRERGREDRETGRLRAEMRRALRRGDETNAAAIERLLMEMEDRRLAGR